MIRDFRQTPPAIGYPILQDGTLFWVGIYVLREPEHKELDTCFRYREELEEKFNLKREEIVMFGDTSEAPSNRIMKHILDVELIKFEGDMRKAYTCFEGLTRDESTHLTPLDSWNCLYHKLLRPKYILVLRIDAKHITEFTT